MRSSQCSAGALSPQSRRRMKGVGRRPRELALRRRSKREPRRLSASARPRRVCRVRVQPFGLPAYRRASPRRRGRSRRTSRCHPRATDRRRRCDAHVDGQGGPRRRAARRLDSGMRHNAPSASRTPRLPTRCGRQARSPTGPSCRSPSAWGRRRDDPGRARRKSSPSRSAKAPPAAHLPRRVARRSARGSHRARAPTPAAGTPRLRSTVPCRSPRACVPFFLTRPVGRPSPLPASEGPRRVSLRGTDVRSESRRRRRLNGPSRLVARRILALLARYRSAICCPVRFALVMQNARTPPSLSAASSPGRRRIRSSLSNTAHSCSAAHEIPSSSATR